MLCELAAKADVLSMSVNPVLAKAEQPVLAAMIESVDEASDTLCVRLNLVSVKTR